MKLLFDILEIILYWIFILIAWIIIAILMVTVAPIGLLVKLLRAGEPQ